ncbi:DgyrCDS261 [Dimorphilus gyrociliatus]|uniref:DgyrCDS261 n=1 Tax=Dimorphilus gyrociliatus TaxID=2664684 RepID=A0A7I8V5A4_9ANNE|nr:DgyrCDS261 [Dimorphilus gyrociliatus]
MPLSMDPIEVLHPNTPDLSENDSRPESGNSVCSSNFQPGLNAISLDMDKTSKNKKKRVWQTLKNKGKSLQSAKDFLKDKIKLKRNKNRVQEISIQQEDDNDKWSTRVIRRPKSEPNFFSSRSQPGKLKKEDSLYVCDIDENE